MSRKDKIYCAVVCIGLLLALVATAYWYYPHGKATFDPVRSQMPQEQEINAVNINRATAGNLQCLEGIGEKRALAIIEYREQFGNFLSAEDLDFVDGIGKKTIERNRNIIYAEQEGETNDAR